MKQYLTQFMLSSNGRLPALVAFRMTGDRLAQQQNDVFLILLVVVAVVSIIALAERNKIIDLG